MMGVYMIRGMIKKWIMRVLKIWNERSSLCWMDDESDVKQLRVKKTNTIQSHTCPQNSTVTSQSPLSLL